MRRAVRIDCQVVREHDFKLLGESTLDLSADGMRIVSNVDVLTGEDVIVTFRTPRTRVWFDTQAHVARVEHGRRPGDRGRALGLRFAWSDGFSRFVLGADLRGLAPPVPRRIQRVDYAESMRRMMVG